MMTVGGMHPAIKREMAMNKHTKWGLASAAAKSVYGSRLISDAKMYFDKEKANAPRANITIVPPPQPVQTAAPVKVEAEVTSVASGASSAEVVDAVESFYHNRYY